MSEQNENSNKKYRCWINTKDRILTFNYTDGYELMEFDNYEEFQEYYYKKTYWGYQVR